MVSCWWCDLVEVWYCECEEDNSGGRRGVVQSVAHDVDVVAVIVVAETETLACSNSSQSSEDRSVSRTRSSGSVAARSAECGCATWLQLVCALPQNGSEVLAGWLGRCDILLVQ